MPESRWAGSPAVPLAEAAARIGVEFDDVARGAARRLPLRFPSGYLDLVRPDDPADPIRAIAWPDPEELRADPEAIADPVGEGTRRLGPFAIQKYPDRALLLVTRRCHFYCRFCFRAGQEREPAASDLRSAIDRLAQIPTLREVILSGGDPLVLPDDELSAIVGDLHRIRSLETIRIHTRAPIHDPSRVTEKSIAALQQAAAPLPLRFGVHVTHPRELTAAVERALATLRSGGATSHDRSLLSQTVLLAGVNADATLLAELYRRLGSLGVVPYYLHHPDRVAGTSRFRITIEAGLALYRELKRFLPEPLWPQYVIDPPDGGGKIAVERLQPIDAVDGAPRYRIDRGDGRDTIYTDLMATIAAPPAIEMRDRE